MSNSNNDIISCLSSDDENKDDHCSQKENVESEIEVMDKAQHATTMIAPNNDDDNDEELQLVGTANEQKFPHNRQDCLECRYTIDSGNGNLSNARFCELCYCYVCDKPASECVTWFRGEKGICSDAGANNDSTEKKAANGNNNNNLEQYKNHCHAMDRGSGSQLWKNMRQAVKDGRDPSLVSEGTAAPAWNGHMAAFYASAHSAAVAQQASRGRARYRNPATARGGARQGRDVGAAAAAPRHRTRRVSAGRARPAPHDHRQRIRTQQLLEELYK